METPQILSHSFPRGICELCIEGGAKLQGHGTDSGATVYGIYCPHNYSAAFLVRRADGDAGPWRIETPVARGDLDRLMAMAAGCVDGVADRVRAVAAAGAPDPAHLN